MEIITLTEIVYLLLTTFVVGYIFSGYIPYYKKTEDTEDELIRSYERKFFDWDAVKFAIIVAAPGIILHELGHKFVAMFFGLNARFQVFWIGLVIGFFLKLAASPIMILAPGYVEITGNATILQSTLVAFAGPFVNLVLWLSSWYMLKTRKNMKTRTVMVLSLMKQINMILFLFNMLPIPPFDGYQVFYGLYKMIFV